MSTRDYYTTLGVARDSTDDEIKNAYRKLASKYHPDKFTEQTDKDSAEVKFKEIKEAYEAISTQEKRATSEHSNNPWTHSSHKGSKSWSFEEDFRGNPEFDQIFQELFKHKTTRGSWGAGEPPKQRTTVVNINLADAYIGRSITVDNHVLNIPKGVRSGTKFYHHGKMVQVEVSSHEKFKRSNDDLLIDASITAIEAMLGIATKLDHLDGTTLQFNIPPGIQNGQIIKLSGKGMKNPEHNKSGDMLVRIAISIPKALSDSEKSLLQQFNHRTTFEI